MYLFHPYNIVHAVLPLGDFGREIRERLAGDRGRFADENVQRRVLRRGYCVQRTPGLAFFTADSGAERIRRRSDTQPRLQGTRKIRKYERSRNRFRSIRYRH